MVPKRAANAAAFPVGAEVEVCNNTAGFRGSWYEATIVQVLPRRRSYDVEYVSRVADDDPTQPLRKTVLGSLVRPRRPRKVSSACYAVGELVDAYRNGGWRRGVVFDSHGGDPPERYTVSFTGTKEKMGFSPAEIRPHLDWRHGHWCPPENQRRGQPSLTGKNPDLSSSSFPPSPSEDLEQANPMSLKRKMTGRPDSEGQEEELVPKKVLKNEESFQVGMEIDPKTPAADKEALAATHDFESPPTELATLPENPLFDELGVEQRSVKGKSPIGLVVPGEKSSNITEQVSKTQNIKHLFSTFISGKLVLPNQWGNNKGVRSPREVVGVQINPPAIEERRRQEVADLTGVKQHPSAEAKKRRGRPPKKSLANINSAKPQPPQKTGDRVVDSAVTSGANKYKQGLTSGNVPSLSRQVEVLMPASSPVAVKGAKLLPPATSSDQVVESNGTRTGVNLNKQIKLNDASGNVPSLTHQVEGVLPANVPSMTHQVEGVLPANVPSMTHQVEVVLPASSPVAVTGAKPLLPTTSSVQVVESSGTRTEINLNKQIMLNDASGNVPSSSHQVEGVLPASSPVAVIGAKLLLPTTSSDRVVESSGTRTEINLNKQIMLNDASGNVPSSSHQVEWVLPASSPVGVTGAKLLQPTTTSDRVESSGTSNVVNLNKQGMVTVVLGNVPSSSRQVEVMMSANSPVAVRDVSDGAANKEIGLLTAHDVVPRNDTATEGEDRVPPPPANVDPTPVESLPKKLPFKKTSVLWEQVESMEVLRTIPQDPHFGLVVKESGKDFCEGTAIGLMVTFGNVVKGISNLDLSDSNQAFEEKLKSLKQLEENGFSVERLRARIVQLLEEKIKLSEIDNERTALKEKASEVSAEMERISVSSFVVDKTIDELHLHLAGLNEKKGDLDAQEMIKGAELAELQKERVAAVMARRSAVRRFRMTAAAPW